MPSITQLQIKKLQASKHLLYIVSSKHAMPYEFLNEKVDLQKTETSGIALLCYTYSPTELVYCCERGGVQGNRWSEGTTMGLQHIFALRQH